MNIKMPTTNSDNGANSTKQFTSFGFSKKLPNRKLEDSRIRDASTKNEEEEKDYVLQVDSQKGIDSTRPKEVPKTELIIPCVGNKYKFDEGYGTRSEKKNVSKAIPEKQLDIVAQELIQDSKDWEQRQEENDDSYKKNANLTIQMAEDDEEALFKEDVESRADISTLDEYESIPVAGFGMGMLRGMGFKKEEGVGGFKKAAVDCIEPKFRPKGLGLGAAIPKKDVSKSKTVDAKEDLALVKGAYVFIEKGTKQDKDIDKYGTRYGQVDGLDEESARVMVKMALGGKIRSVSENIVRVVSKSEYKEYAKVVNKEQYKSHVEKEKHKNSERETSREDRDSDRKSKTHEREREKNSNRSYNDKRSKERSRSPLSDKYSTDKQYQTDNREPTLLRPHLKVRIIDKHYKGGRYYKTKAIIEDVVDPFTCICRTIDSEKSKVLDNVPSSYFETVIPKENGVVMVLSGTYKGQLGEILIKDKHKSRAEIQLLNGKEVVRIDYDHLCEFMGDLDMYS
jgi:G patch domain/KOW motif-containing protein